MFYICRNPEANWGSSAQGQIFVSAIKSVHQVTETPDHVKNYRPKLLVLTGNPGHRPALVDFANLITKKVSFFFNSCLLPLLEQRTGGLKLSRNCIGFVF